MMIKSILLAMFLSVLVIGTADAVVVVENFESYANTAALNAVWTNTGGAVATTTLNTDSTQYMAISANLGPSPWNSEVSRNYGGVDWTGQGGFLKIGYRGTSGTASDGMEVELVNQANWSQKWQSGVWNVPNDNTWYTKTFDVSGVSFLNNVGPVNIVLKGTSSYGTPTISVDNLQVIPEPTSLLLLGTGLVGLLGFSKKKRI